MPTILTLKGFTYRVLGWRVDKEGYRYLLVDSPSYDESRILSGHYPRKWTPSSPDHNDGSDECAFLEGEPCYVKKEEL